MNTKPWPILTETGLDTAALPEPLRARKPWHYTVGDVFALPPEQCAAARRRHHRGAARRAGQRGSGGRRRRASHWRISRPATSEPR